MKTEKDFRKIYFKATNMSREELIADCGKTPFDLAEAIETADDFSNFFDFISNKYRMFGGDTHESLEDLFAAISNVIDNKVYDLEELTKQGRSVWSASAMAIYIGIFYQ